MKKTIEVLVIVAMIGLFCSCGAEQEAADTMQMEPQLSQMKTISEWATMECYYHNVAEYYQKNASGYLLWKKDKNFWIDPPGKQGSVWDFSGNQRKTEWYNNRTSNL